MWIHHSFICSSFLSENLINVFTYNYHDLCNDTVIHYSESISWPQRLNFWLTSQKINNMPEISQGFALNPPSSCVLSQGKFNGLWESTQPTLLSPGFPTRSAFTVEATRIASMLSYTLHAPDHEGMYVRLCCGDLTGASRWEDKSPLSTVQTARGCGWPVVLSATQGSAGLSKAPSSLADTVRQKRAEPLSPSQSCFLCCQALYYREAQHAGTKTDHKQNTGQ